jgi:hypothetical protein
VTVRAYTDLEWEASNFEKLYAPSLRQLVAALLTVHPSLSEDVVFVRDQTLKAFEKSQEGTMGLRFTFRTDKDTSMD